jgi:hypothetical protein
MRGVVTGDGVGSDRQILSIAVALVVLTMSACQAEPDEAADSELFDVAAASAEICSEIDDDTEMSHYNDLVREYAGRDSGERHAIRSAVNNRCGDVLANMRDRGSDRASERGSERALREDATRAQEMREHLPATKSAMLREFRSLPRAEVREYCRLYRFDREELERFMDQGVARADGWGPAPRHVVRQAFLEVLEDDCPS